MAEDKKTEATPEVEAATSQEAPQAIATETSP